MLLAGGGGLIEMGGCTGEIAVVRDCQNASYRARKFPVIQIPTISSINHRAPAVRRNAAAAASAFTDASTVAFANVPHERFG